MTYTLNVIFSTFLMDSFDYKFKTQQILFYHDSYFPLVHKQKDDLLFIINKEREAMLVEDSLISSQNLLFNLRSVENEKW